MIVLWQACYLHWSPHADHLHVEVVGASGRRYEDPAWPWLTWWTDAHDRTVRVDAQPFRPHALEGILRHLVARSPLPLPVWDEAVWAIRREGHDG
ncbi:MAG: hypothetical protein K6V97_04020 [Actinomycetia bacterium]|nr:hypothetical protein [Actinomycetes bacterium]